MIIPIFNSLYPNHENKIRSNKLDLNILNNLKLAYVKKARYPVIKIIDKMPERESLFETIIVSTNDALVNLFLEGKIKFTDISKILLKTIQMKKFNKYKKIIPKNIKEITQLSDYVSIKINSLSV
jgi:1-deoxy-D-xylulose-5-phosphate reductoisomerase